MDGPGSLVLGGDNSYAGGTYIDSGTLGAVGNGSAFGTGTIHLNGGSLGGGNSATLSNSIEVDANSSLLVCGTLTLSGAITGSGNLTVTNSVYDGGNCDFTPDGQSTLYLTGNNSQFGGTFIQSESSGSMTTEFSSLDYDGATIIEGGTVQVDGATPTMNLLSNTGGVDIQNGSLVLDYNSGTDPASTVQSLLTAAYNGGVNSFQSGQIRNTSATSSVGLGWMDRRERPSTEDHGRDLRRRESGRRGGLCGPWHRGRAPRPVRHDVGSRRLQLRRCGGLARLELRVAGVNGAS